MTMPDLRNLAGRSFRLLTTGEVFTFDADGECREWFGDDFANPISVRALLGVRIYNGSVVEVTEEKRCACKGTLTEGDVEHEPQICRAFSEKNADGSTASIYIRACDCLLPTCPNCKDRPTVEAERFWAMCARDGATDSWDRRDSERPPGDTHYSPSHLMGGAWRIR